MGFLYVGESLWNGVILNLGISPSTISSRLDKADPRGPGRLRSGIDEEMGARRDRRVLTVLKYSIDFIIFPFSSGINNIPKASLALPSAFPVTPDTPVQKSMLWSRKKKTYSSGAEVRDAAAIWIFRLLNSARIVGTSL
jgi:hypothetical protein